MLDRIDYESWSQRIRLYCRGKENGLQILQSIDQGPFELGTTRDTLGTTPEGGVLLGPERPRTYEDLMQWGAHNRAGNANAGQGKLVKCYNCNGVGHIARNCYCRRSSTELRLISRQMPADVSPKNRCSFGEEGTKLFLAGEQGNTFDADVDNQPMMKPTAQNIFIANLLSLAGVQTIHKLAIECIICLETHHVPVNVPSSEEELELAEATRNKLHVKMNDSACVEKRAQLKDNSKCVTIPDSKPKVLAPSRYPIDVEPIPPRLNKNQEVHLHYIKHLKENVETLREIVKEAKVKRPLDTSLAFACRYTKHSQEILEYVIGTCPKDFSPRDKQNASTNSRRKKQVSFVEPCETSTHNTPPQVEHQKIHLTNAPGIPSTGVNGASTPSRSKPRNNTKKDRTLPAKSAMKQVEAHSRMNKSNEKQKNCVDSSISYKRTWPLTRNTPPKVLPTKQRKPTGRLLLLRRQCPLVRSTALKSDCMPADPPGNYCPYCTDRSLVFGIRQLKTYD
ncbi:integrase, catalytic region, zinc finger, CCHC-type containing protein [Tanacetum coccineum]